MHARTDTAPWDPTRVLRRIYYTQNLDKHLIEQFFFFVLEQKRSGVVCLMPARKSPDDKRCSCGIGGVLRHNKVQVNNLVGFHELHVLRCAQFYSTVQDFLG